MLSTQLLTLIKRLEGFRTQAYQDSGGVWTIGYGSTGPNIGKGLVWTIEQADADLIRRLQYFQAGVVKATKTQLNPNQLDALTSFAYNAGLGAYEGSTLKKWIELKQFRKAADEFQKWVYVKGKKDQVLVQRRKVEEQLFMKETN